MNWLAENALPIWMGGAVALTMALHRLFSNAQPTVRCSASLGVVRRHGRLAAHRAADRNATRGGRTHALQLAATVEANEWRARSAYLAPSANAELRKDVETLMPQVRDRAGPRHRHAADRRRCSSANAATVQCRGIIMAVNKQDGMKGGGDDRLVLQWVRRGDRWLLESYTSQKNWNRAIGRRRTQ